MDNLELTREVERLNKELEDCNQKIKELEFKVKQNLEIALTRISQDVTGCYLQMKSLEERLR